jgi:unsaturated rhamnogalacturonyl hydrolase
MNRLNRVSLLAGLLALGCGEQSASTPSAAGAGAGGASAVAGMSGVTSGGRSASGAGGMSAGTGAAAGAPPPAGGMSGAMSGGSSGQPATGGATSGTGGIHSGSGGALAGAGASGTGSGGMSAGGGGASAGIGGMSQAGGGTGAGTPVLDGDSLAVRFADAVMARAPDPLDITTGATFEYNHGIVLRGIEQVYRYTKQPKYLHYIQSYVDHFVSSTGDISIASGYSLDNIQPAVLLPFLFAETGEQKYKTAAAQVRTLYDAFPKNGDGGFWHKQTYPNQMWLDSIYMGEPFLAEYGAVIGGCASFCADTVVLQSSLIASHVQSSTSGLLEHAWDASSGAKASWANPTTGVSPEVWGRALGWYVMSLVDNLPLLPDGTIGKAELVTVLGKALDGIAKAQDANTGLWYQVVDKGDRSDDWLETSGSGMFVYALAAGIRRGLVAASLSAVATKGYDGLKTKVTFDGQGRPSITGAVHGMGVQDDYAGYLNQMPLLTDSPHGLCAVLLAASEMDAHAP